MNTTMNKEEPEKSEPLNATGVALIIAAAVALMLGVVRAFPDTAIYFIVGFYVFLLFQPVLNVRASTPTRRLALEAVIAAFACGVLFILFKIFGAELDQVEVAIIFAAGLGIKLVFYPVYGDGTEN
ncbi:MAG: hypothetical protein AB7W16_12195 [Candidatus Obscuribacterales bacterium]